MKTDSMIESIVDAYERTKSLMVAPVLVEEAAFPLTWSHPFDATYTYFFDPMHFPRPITPLFATVVGPAFEYGFTKAARELDAPILGARVSVQNHYYFNAFIPDVLESEDEARAVGERAEATMRVEVGRLMERWKREHLPQIKARLARLEDMDVASAPRHEMPSLLDEVVEIWSQNWATHFRIVIPMMIAMQVFDEYFIDLFDGTEQDSHALLIGAASESVKAGIGLSDLAGAARAAGLDKLLLTTPAEEVMAELGSHPMGGYFASAIRDYLHDYGLRQDLFDFITPTWREDPSIAIANIQSYLRSGHDAEAEHRASVKLAEFALASARKQLEVFPEAVRAQFEGMLQAARDASFLQEEHNFYIDQQMLAQTRLLFLKLGWRLASDGVLEQAEDVFFLSVDDLKVIYSAPILEDGVVAREVVSERREELARAESLTPPPFVGVPPAGPPPMDTPVDRAMVRFFGGPPQQADQPNQLKGNPGSRGCAQGVARVVQSLEEAKALQPGEILVTITTMPAWTPLFGTAAALVTETGGALSHGAIVAREYGIPAVVGAFGATRAIRTGQLITVDGTMGLVTIDAD